MARPNLHRRGGGSGGRSVRPHTRLFKREHDMVVEAGGWKALITYIALLRAHSNAAPEEKHHFRAGAGRLAKIVDVSPATIKRSLPILVKLGLIEVTSGRRADRNGDHEPNRFRLLDTPSEDEAGRVSQHLPRRVSQHLGSGLTDTRINGTLKSPKEINPRSARRALGGAPASGEEDYSWEPLEL